MSPRTILNYLVCVCALAVLKDQVNGEELEKLMLSKFLTSGKLEEAREAALVTWKSESLDSVPSYSGYLTVNETTNSSMFFWFIPSVYEDPEEAPLILWLNGGPGKSSMFGLFNENGPFKIKKRGRLPRLVLRLRKDTWARKHSMLFIDNPIGSGFSFTDDDAGYAKNQDDVSRDLYNALGQFFTIFPDVSKQDFYLAGESYAGKFIPHLAMKIHEENKIENGTQINLKGLITGGPFTDPLTMTSHFSDYFYNLGLIDEHGLAHFKEQEALTVKLIQDGKHDEAIKVNDDLLSEVFVDHPSYFKNQTGFESLSSALESKPSRKLAYFSQYLNTTNVRKIIHVGNQQFKMTNIKVAEFLKGDLFSSCKSEMEQLINLKYKVLVYVGQFDLITPHTAVSNFIQSMNFDGKAEYEKSDRRIIREKIGDVSGYVKSAGNFYYVIVRDAGHFVPRDQPRWSREIVERFIRGGKQEL